jgi:trk system potassium uptake protein TrkH
MNPHAVLRVFGGLLIFLGAALAAMIPFSLFFGDGSTSAFAAAATAAGLPGALLFRMLPPSNEVGHREGFAIVTLGWIAYAVIGGLPYLVAGIVDHPADAFFEAMSGFTTTGSTVLTGLDSMAPTVLLWRSLTQWFGGMGIIVLTLAILPILGIGGMQLFRAEVPGPTADRLSPRIQDTAKALWQVYIALTVVQMILLRITGMGWFDAACHGFTTLATGGFSTRDASLAGFGAGTQWVTIVFMLMAGINFNLHWYAVRRRSLRGYLRSAEFRLYVGLLVTAASLIVIDLGLAGRGWHKDNVRDAIFQTISIVTTTGFGSADYELWPAFSQALVFSLLFIGGSAGSTAGGMKLVRLLLIGKYAYDQLFRLVHPRGVRVLKLDGKPVDAEVMQGVLGFITIFVSIYVGGTMLLAATGLDYMTAASAAVTALANVGPGFGQIGPTENFAGLTATAKVLLGGLMLLGRLELFTVLVLFLPSFWRR